MLSFPCTVSSSSPVPALLSISWCASSHLFFSPLPPASCFLSPFPHFLSAIHSLSNPILPPPPCCTGHTHVTSNLPSPTNKKREGWWRSVSGPQKELRWCKLEVGGREGRFRWQVWDSFWNPFSSPSLPHSALPFLIKSWTPWAGAPVSVICHCGWRGRMGGREGAC